MKKVLTILAVLALAAPAMAQDAITVTVTPTPGTLTISWDATGAASGGPVGFALAVNCSAGQIDSIDSVTSFFDIFIDLAYDQETTTPGSYVYGAGTLADIAADPAGPGVVALPSSDFVLSFAGLGGASGTPIEPFLTGSIVLKSPAGATVDVALDEIRGGIVNKGGVMTVTGLPATGIVVPPLVTECFAVGTVFTYTGPGPAVTVTVTTDMYNRWISFGSPCSWCCLGNMAGNVAFRSTAVPPVVNGIVNNTDLNGLKASFGKPVGGGYNPAADLDRNGVVNNTDLNRLKQHFGLTVGDCEGLTGCNY